MYYHNYVLLTCLFRYPRNNIEIILNAELKVSCV